MSEDATRPPGWEAISAQFSGWAATPEGIAVLGAATLIGGAAVLWVWGRAIYDALAHLLGRLIGPARVGSVGVPAGAEVIGREDIVRDMRRRLLGWRRDRKRAAGLVLHAEGGVGKSTLARRYVEVHGGGCHGVLWARAATRRELVEGLCRLAPHLGLEAPDPATEAGAQAVLAAVRATRRRWLFVYDNVETRADLEGLVPEGAHLIVTTRSGGDWPGFEKLATEALAFDRPEAPAVRLLMREAGRDDDPEGARTLAEALGGLPLGLVVTGALVRTHGGTWAEWSRRLAEVLEHVPKDAGYPTSIRGAVELSYARLGADARLIADLFAWWAPEGLSAELLTEAPGRWFWHDEVVREGLTDAVAALAEDGARVRAGVVELVGASLISGLAGDFAMHRMTAAALRAMQGAAPQSGAAAALLAAVYPGGDNNPAFSGNWPACKRLTPHVRALWAGGGAPRTAAMDYLLNQSAIYLGKIGDAAGSVEAARTALDLTRARLPEEHRDIAVGLATLGGALGRAGVLAEAEALLAEAVRLDEAHRPDSEDLADHYDMHGGRLLALARAGDAERLVPALRRCQQALALRRRLFGRDSDPVAAALNNLGTARSAQGRGAAAARLYGAALRIWRVVLSAGDARLAYGAMNTGAMWLKAGEADRAEPLLAEALAIWEAAYADQPDHAERRLAADWLATCLLVRARAGEDRARREARARDLCGRYGLDLAQMQADARRLPCAPGG